MKRKKDYCDKTMRQTQKKREIRNTDAHAYIPLNLGTYIRW